MRGKQRGTGTDLYQERKSLLRTFEGRDYLGTCLPAYTPVFLPHTMSSWGPGILAVLGRACLLAPPPPSLKPERSDGLAHRTL